jgi:hypothetical protein
MNNTKLMDELQDKIAHFGELIGAPAKFLPDQEYKTEGKPYIEIDELFGIFYFVVSERGIELRRTATKDIDELL